MSMFYPTLLFFAYPYLARSQRFSFGLLFSFLLFSISFCVKFGLLLLVWLWMVDLKVEALCGFDSVLCFVVACGV